MTHMDVTFKIKGRRSCESKSLEVGIQRDLMTIISIVCSSERTNQLFVRDTTEAVEKKKQIRDRFLTRNGYLPIGINKLQPLLGSVVSNAVLNKDVKTSCGRHEKVRCQDMFERIFLRQRILPFSLFMCMSKVKGSPTVTGPDVLLPAVPNPRLTSI